MSNLKNVTDKRSSIIMFSVLVILVFTKALSYPLGDLDELWNYNLCRGVSMGYVPYRDFSMELVPLYTVLFSIPLRIYRSMLVYRLTTSVLLAAESFMIYKIAVKMINVLSGALISLVFVFMIDIATYNGLFFLCALIGFCLLYGEVGVRDSVGVGCISAISIFCRQTSGFFLFVAIVMLFIFDRKLRKNLIHFVCGSMTVFFMFLLYFVLTGSFRQFWDCCLFSLITSDAVNTAVGMDALPVLIFLMLCMILDFVLWKRRKDINYIRHLVIGIVIASISVPIVDNMHLYYSECWFLIPVILWCKDRFGLRVNPVVMKGIVIAVAIVNLLVFSLGLTGTVMDDRYRELRFIPMADAFLDGYSEINDINLYYEDQGYDVVVLSSGACLFSIMNEEFDPGYDLFLTGNFGTADPIERIEDTTGADKVMILMPDDYQEENWQNPAGVADYVMNNFTPVARYGYFVWYCCFASYTDLSLSTP